MVEKRSRPKMATFVNPGYNFYRPLPMFGFILLGIGVIWLLKETGVIPNSFPIWPIVLIIIGVVMILNRIKGRR